MAPEYGDDDVEPRPEMRELSIEDWTSTAPEVEPDDAEDQDGDEGQEFDTDDESDDE